MIVSKILFAKKEKKKVKQEGTHVGMSRLNAKEIKFVYSETSKRREISK